jgi:hypothetical protein
MKNVTRSLLSFSLLLLVACSSTSTLTRSTKPLDNMAIMGRYTLNNLVFMDVFPLSRNQISIKVNGNGCNFSDVGYLANNATTVRGITFTFSEQAVMVTGSGLGKCGGEYVKTPSAWG